MTENDSQELEDALRSAHDRVLRAQEALDSAFEERSRALMRLRKQGYEYAQLGELMGLTKQRAHQLVSAMRGIRY